MNSFFDKLVQNNFITVNEKISKSQAMSVMSYDTTKEMINSDWFYLKEVDIDCFYESKRYLKKSESVGPIIADYCYSQVLILDGSHRWLDAKSRGATTIKAWIGEKALNHISKKQNSIDQYSKFLELIKNKNIAIFSHPSPDADAIGSMIGIQWLLRKLEVKSKLFYSGSIDHPKCKEICKFFKLQEESKYNQEEYDLKILCDTVSDCPNNYDIIIDHHMVTLSDYNGLYLHSEASSCCSIICDLIRRFFHDIDPIVSVALLSGIKDDSFDLTSSNLMDIDIESYWFLFKSCDKQLFENIKSPKCSKQILNIKAKAFNNVKFFNDYAITNVGLITKDEKYILEEITNDLIFLEVDLIICYGQIEDMICGFLRSNSNKSLKKICVYLGKSVYGDGKIGEGSYCHKKTIDEEHRINTILNGIKFI